MSTRPRLLSSTAFSLAMLALTFHCGGKSSSSTPVEGAPAGFQLNVTEDLRSGMTGLVASAPSLAGARYEWTITGDANITAGAGTNQITFKVGNPGAITIICVMKNAGGATAGVAPLTVLDPNGKPYMRVGKLDSAASILEFTGGYMPADTDNLGAAMIALPGSSFAWTVSDGTITSESTGDRITFTSGKGPAVTVACRFFSKGGWSNYLMKFTTIPKTDAPDLRLPTFVTANSTNNSANVTEKVVNGFPFAYSWKMEGGTITSANDTPRINFTAGAEGRIHVDVTITNHPFGGNQTFGYGNAITIVPPAEAPVIELPSIALVPGVAYSASAATATGALSWSIVGGVINGSPNGPIVSFTPTPAASSATPGVVTLSATQTNAAGTPSPIGTATAEVSS